MLMAKAASVAPEEGGLDGAHRGHGLFGREAVEDYDFLFIHGVKCITFRLLPASSYPVIALARSRPRIDPPQSSRVD